MKTYNFHINGMHCRSCEILTEDELGKLPEVQRVKSFLKSHSIEIVGDFGDRSKEHIAMDLNEVLKQYGYSLSIERQKHRVSWEDFYIALPIAAAFVGLFIFLQKIGVVNLIGSGNIGYGTAFIVGLVASVSTCMAVVGGLVLSVSVNFAKDGDKIRPQGLFHIGRLISFFVFGGVIGVLGSAFQLGSSSAFVLSFIVAIILLILGINLLDIFPWVKRLQPTLPGFITKHISGLKDLNHTITPFLLGTATFFLPCGFTQSMQIYSLSTGSFFSGAFTMLIFALGTLPVLALLSFSSLTIPKSKSGIFFKTAGLVVIFFGLFNLINSLVGFGVISPIFNF
jgi:sulfite exporter TauE/SafE/copper chaperone CopZ